MATLPTPVATTPASAIIPSTPQGNFIKILSTYKEAQGLLLDFIAIASHPQFKTLENSKVMNITRLVDLFLSDKPSNTMFSYAKEELEGLRQKLPALSDTERPLYETVCKLIRQVDVDALIAKGTPEKTAIGPAPMIQLTSILSLEQKKTVLEQFIHSKYNHCLIC